MKGAILVVEDEQAIADLVRAYLRREGFDVVWARSGEQALEELARHPVRLVVLDIGLPGIDGYQVVRRLRQDAEFSSIYAIALTGYGRDEDQKNARDAGFNLHLIKPIDYNNLRNTLAALAVA